LNTIVDFEIILTTTNCHTKHTALFDSDMVAKTRALFDGAVGEIVDNFQHHRQGLLAKLDAVRQANDGQTPAERSSHRGRSETMCRYENLTKKALRFGVHTLSKSEYAGLSKRQGHGPNKHQERVSAVEHEELVGAAKQESALDETPPDQCITKTRTKFGPEVIAALLDAFNNTPVNECIQWSKYEVVSSRQISARAASQWVSTYRLSRGKKTGRYSDKAKQGIVNVVATGVKLNKDCGNLVVRERSGVKRTGRQVRALVENVERTKMAKRSKESEGSGALVLAAVARQGKRDIEEVAFGKVAQDCGTGTVEAALELFLKASPDYACALPESGGLVQEHMDNLILKWCNQNNQGELSATAKVCRAIAKAQFRPFVRDGLNYHSSTIRQRVRTLVKKPKGSIGVVGDLVVDPVNASTANEALVVIVRNYCDRYKVNVECIDKYGAWTDFAKQANKAAKEEYKYGNSIHIKTQFYNTDDRYVDGRGTDDERAAMLATIKSWMMKHGVPRAKIANAEGLKWRQLAMEEFQKEDKHWRHSIYLQGAAKMYMRKLKRTNSQW
jgi:hypothetical protein